MNTTAIGETVTSETTDAATKPVWTPTEGKALVLRTCDADRRSYDGFLWPESGPVECPDWMPTTQCGNGLHGALWGQGDGNLLKWDSDAIWQVVEVDVADVVDLGGKVKFPRGVVVYSSERQVAVELIQAHAPAGTVVIGGTATAGDSGTATAGDRGTATAGYSGTATAGEAGYIAITWYDDKTGRYRRAYGEIGENGLEPGVAYVVRDGKLAPAQVQP